MRPRAANANHSSRPWRDLQMKKRLTLRPASFYSANSNLLLSSHKRHMNVSAQANVIGKVPAYVIRVFVDRDVIAVPVPVVAIAGIVRSYGEVISVKPEASGTTAAQMPDVRATESSIEAAVLPRMIDAIVIVAAAGIMAHPDFSIYVRCVGMSIVVSEVAMFIGLMRVTVKLTWSMRRRSAVWVSMVPVIVIVVLCKCRQREGDQSCQC